MKFECNKAIEILERTPLCLEGMLQGLSDEWVETNEGEGTWSAYDIVGHLIHGERTDWIPRMERILLNPLNKEFLPFDRNAHFKNSKGKSMRELLFQFKYLREINVDILKAYSPVEQLDDKGIHPDFGEVTLRQLLATWVTHDMSHLAQIARVIAKQYADEVGPWKAYLGILK